MSLRRKMLYIFSTLSCCCLLFAMVVSGIETYRTTRRMNTENLNQSVELYSEKTNTWFKSAASILDSLAIYMEQQTKSGISENNIRNYNEELTKNYSFAQDIYTTDTDGNFYDGTGWIPDADWSCKTREWYVLATEKKKTIYGSPYVDIITGNLITYISKPYFINGKIGGTATMDITLDGLSELINSFSKSSEYVYFMLTDSDGNVIIHENSSFNPTKDNILNIKDVLDGEYEVYANSGNPMKDYNGNSVYIVSSLIGETGWTIYLIEDSSVFISDLKRLILMFIIIMLAAQGIIIFVTYMVSKSIVDRIDTAKNAALKMAKGDFSFEIKSTSGDELGSLADSMKTLCENTNDIISDLGHILGGMEQGDLTTKSKDPNMYKGDYFKLITSIRNFRNKITEAMTDISEVSSSVNESSAQVSQGAQTLSQGSSEQTASIEELSASIQVFSKQISDNAEFSGQAMEQTNKSDAEMTKAAENMEHLISAMNDIHNCSNKIGNIIKTIEDISFQTNILALNASVEAARAGAAGKGFAVVADEVRNLAGKSAEASANTAELIENTVAAIERGNTLVNETASVMKQVRASSKICTELNTKICEVSEETVSSIRQINTGVANISGVVQTNAATAEQSAAVSEELSRQAYTLKQLVDEFVLK